MQILFGVILVLIMASGCSDDPATEPVMVSYVVSPDPDIFGFTQRAVYRWNQARGCTEGSGCELVIGEGGIPVKYVPEILMPELGINGQPLRAAGASQPMPPGTAGCDWKYVHVSLETSDAERTLVHEIGHVLGIIEHTATGVTMDRSRLSDAEAKEQRAWSITEESLTEVCTKTSCLGFRPEAP